MYTTEKLATKKLKTTLRTKTALEVLAVLSCTPFIVSFFLNSGFTQFNTINIINDIGRLSGLLAVNLMIIQLIAISRMELLDSLYGLDKLTYFHKRLGKPVYYLLIVHFAASLYSWAANEQLDLLSELTKMFTISDLLLAIISFAIFTLIIITSLNSVRKKLPYEVWYFVHISAYAAVFIAFPHIVSVGTDTQDYWSKLYLWSIYIICIVLILVYRFLLPAYRSLSQGLKVTKIVHEANNAVSIYVEGRDLDKLPHEAGQFYLWRFFTLDLFLQAHPFSLSAAPNNKWLRLTVADLGDGSHKLQKVKKGTRVAIEGPYGVFTEQRRTKEKVTLIGSGVGITPIRSLAEAMSVPSGDLNIIYRGRKPERMPFIDELDEIVATKRGTINYSWGPRVRSNSWLAADVGMKHDDEALLHMVPNVADSDVYICGPVAWTHSVERTLIKVGVPKTQIHLEEFAW